MMNKDKIYYHIQKKVDNKPEWFAGEEYFINPDEINYFQKGLISGLEYKTKNKEGETIGQIKYVSDLLKKSSSNQDLSKSCNDLVTSLTQYLKWIQEDIFEKIRSKNYPNLPSRKSCLWICTYEQLKNWLDIMINFNSRYQQPKTKILSLSIAGVCHQADATYLDADTHKIEDFEFAANNYWSGVYKSNKEIEILFHGKVKVIKEYNNIDEINIY